MKDKDRVKWNDSYSVQFLLIDDQHKGLVRMTNELFSACKKGGSAADVSFMKTVQRAVHYAQNHFKIEETYMEKTDYPGYAAHKKEHEEFVEEVLRQVKTFEDGESEPIAFARFLKGWILNHIALSDKKYAPYLAGIEE